MRRNRGAAFFDAVPCRQATPYDAAICSKVKAVLHRIASLLRESAVPVLRGSALLALVTFAAYKLHLNAAGAGFLYLTVVTLNCLNSSFPAAVVVSLLAVACLDFFFVEPLLTLT